MTEEGYYPVDVLAKSHCQLIVKVDFLALEIILKLEPQISGYDVSLTYRLRITAAFFCLRSLC